MKGLHAMALDKSALLELTEALSSADDGQLMRWLLHATLQALIDAEAAQQIGADPHECTDTRTTLRNGTRDMHPPAATTRHSHAAHPFGLTDIQCCHPLVSELVTNPVDRGR